MYHNIGPRGHNNISRRARSQATTKGPSTESGEHADAEEDGDGTTQTRSDPEEIDGEIDTGQRGDALLHQRHPGDTGAITTAAY